MNDRLPQISNRTGGRIERVARCELPEPVASLVDDYEATIGERDKFIWKWLYHLFPEITLSSVAPEHEKRVRDAKLYASMFVVILDDLAEIRMDRVTFEECSKIPFEYQSVAFDRDGADIAHLRFAERVWREFRETVERAPRYEEFADLLRYDVQQNVNAIDHSYTLNHHLEMANVAETERYDAHNMMLFTYANVDLTHSPSFDSDDLSELRRVVSTAQEMARIGNWITTWEREIDEGDFSSGVLVYALEHGIVSRSDLHELRDDSLSRARQAVVETIHDANVEGVFVEEWYRKHEEIERLATAVTSVDVGAYLAGMETVMTYHQASRGLK